MKYYTYKVTFKDLPGYFYYGSHKYNGKPYLGSPKTWRHLWAQFEPEAQVLQWYSTEKEVKAAEESIIKATWKDKCSLNENVSGRFSEEAAAKGGRISVAVNFTPEVCRANGEKTGPASGKKNGPVNGKKNGKRTAAANGKASSSKRILLTNIATGQTFEFPSAREAARVLGLDRGHLSSVARGGSKQHKGYTARYV
jgi:hypothetical protein